MTAAVNVASLGTAVNADSSGNFKMNSGYGSVAVAYGCRAWVNFNGTGTVAIRASGNVSSITDLGTGTYRANFTTSLSDALYSVAISADNAASNSNSANNIFSFITSSFDWQHIENNAATDSSLMCAAVFR